MRRLLALSLVFALAGQVQAVGLLIPKEKKVPPLAMVNHQVNVTIDDQVAITNVEQTFRNHTDRQLEATYIFPVPKDASVTKFSMWIDGKEVPGEMVEAKKARQIYTDIVRRTLDPGLLEYMGHKLFKLRVFPIPPKGDQKISFSYTSVVPKDNELVLYTYPLKTDGKALQTLEDFSVKVALKSQHSINNIYSPTHAITVTRPNDKEANIVFNKEQALLDRHFQLYYAAGGKDVGFTTITHRPVASKKGYFMFLVSPRAELSKKQQVPRDVVFVLDTSGSMRGRRIEQAKNALKYCLSQLGEMDRFSIVQFATTVNKYSETWEDAHEDNIIQAKKWVGKLAATGGTAIDSALNAALQMRSDDSSRTFTVVFFTDGRPTIGETDADKILKNVIAKNTANTRIFTFGVGDDVNATMLDQMADESRAVSTFVVESEDIQAKVSSLYNKISHPVLTDLQLSVGSAVKISEVYPPKLPDLFHGSQLVVLGRYEGNGHVAVKLAGSVGRESKEFVYEVNFDEKSKVEKPFVEDLWARRKVGYLLDQIRINGEKKELVDEVTALAKYYGITTPYTSYLIVPDAPVPVAQSGSKQGGVPNVSFDLVPGAQAAGTPPPALKTSKAEKQISVNEFIQRFQAKPGDASKKRAEMAGKALSGPIANGLGGYSDAYKMAQMRWQSYNHANRLIKSHNLDKVQNGALGVNLSINNALLRNQCQLTNTATRRVGNTNCLEVGGVWVDEAYHAKLKTVVVKAMSDAYFRILQRRPEMKSVYALGNHLVYVTPSGTALVIDAANGCEQLPDAEIDALFVAKK